MAQLSPLSLSAAIPNRVSARPGLWLTAGLPSLMLASLLGTTPTLAAAPYPVAASPSEPITVAGMFDFIDEIGDAIRTVTDTVEEATNLVDTIQQPFLERAQAQREEEERQLRQLEALQREEERKAVQAAAAEQRRQYFESLTPEEQQAYIAEQRAKEQAQIDIMAGLFLLLLSAEGEAGGDTPTGQEYVIYDQQRPASQPAPAHTTPIGGDRGFYGDTHTPW